MANALRTLGYSVHDFEEHVEYNLENYLDYLEGRVGEEVFLEMYREVDAVVDMPASTLSMVIHQQFPDAKVILMVRSDSEAWLRSYIGTQEEFYTKHMPMFYNILPRFSRTHNLLSESIDRQIEHCFVDMTLFGRQINPLVYNSSHRSKFLSKTIQRNLSITLEGAIHKTQCCSSGIMGQDEKLIMDQCVFAESSATGSTACLQGWGWMGQSV